VNSGSKAWDDPSQYPDLFGYQTSYNAEGKIFAHFIKTHFKGQTVGFIGQNDDFGANGLLGLTDGGVNVASANALTYNAADAITGSTSDIQADVATLAQDNCRVVVLDSVPGFTTGILEVAHALGYSPTWIISSVGADPTSVNFAGEAGAYTLDYFPSVTDTGDPWIPWIRKVLLADKADFPKFTASSILTGNELYGAGFAVAFVEALKADGKNVTRANFVAAMKSTTYADPAITPLKFSASNHQGLTGGVIAKIAANGSKAPVKAIPVNGTVYTTGNSAASPLKSTTTLTISPIPAWLKG
jgi:branched-chain amino acid transport system substrate-binding protein